MSDSKALEDAYVLPTYEKFPFALERGEGCKAEQAAPLYLRNKVALKTFER